MGRKAFVIKLVLNSNNFILAFVIKLVLYSNNFILAFVKAVPVHAVKWNLNINWFSNAI